ncbi:MAG: helix-turn-helix transcriptional regulator [Clostridia bacterium]|nr:helix-turn-helix transcriptional regulator [Clostridia bacterium]
MALSRGFPHAAFLECVVSLCYTLHRKDILVFGGERIVTFGQRLYVLRKTKNISQEELAELLDVSRQSISKWENDKAYPEMTRLLFMSEFFDVSLDYLMRGTEEKSKEAATVSYKARNMLLIWNNFVSNLSGKQRKWLIVLYILLICVCVAMVVSFIYGVGYAIGQFIGHLQNSLPS